MPARPRIYLAGPDVFRPDAADYLNDLARQCATHGFEALIPADNLVTAALPLAEVPRAIFDTNMALLRRADGVIANLAPFRGAEPDAGTAFEVGAAVALGLPVVGYGLAGIYADRVPAQRDTEGVLRDSEGMAVEDFGLPANLMLATSVRIAPTATEAIAMLARLLRAGTGPHST